MGQGSRADFRPPLEPESAFTWACGRKRRVRVRVKIGPEPLQLRLRPIAQSLTSSKQCKRTTKIPKDAGDHLTQWFPEICFGKERNHFPDTLRASTPSTSREKCIVGKRGEAEVLPLGALSLLLPSWEPFNPHQCPKRHKDKPNPFHSREKLWPGIKISAKY